MEIVFASHNAGKIKEVSALLSTFSIIVRSQLELGIPDIEETGLTFVENALLKARHASELSGLPALADDSGLIVNALQGAPGLYSARYAGKHATAQDNIQKLLLEMKNIPEEQRSATFYCTLVLLMHAKDPAPLICTGNWRGKILFSPTGKEGFGYDPVFYDPEVGCSAAELTVDKKNHISHRAQALQCLLQQLPEKLCWHSQSKI